MPRQASKLEAAAERCRVLRAKLSECEKEKAALAEENVALKKRLATVESSLGAVASAGADGAEGLGPLVASLVAGYMDARPIMRGGAVFVVVLAAISHDHGDGDGDAKVLGAFSTVASARAAVFRGLADLGGRVFYGDLWTYDDFFVSPEILDADDEWDYEANEAASAAGVEALLAGAEGAEALFDFNREPDSMRHGAWAECFTMSWRADGTGVLRFDDNSEESSTEYLFSVERILLDPLPSERAAAAAESSDEGV